MDNIPHRFSVYSIALKPETRGNIFASSCADGKLRLFDLRLSSTNPIIQTAYRSGALHSAMFSPSEPSLVATAGLGDGTQLHDIRLPTRCLHFFPSQGGTIEVRFNGRGTRLLCLESNYPPVLYDIAAKRQMEIGHGRMQLVMPEEFNRPLLMDSACFAGQNDELVVAGSEDSGIYVWTIPEGPIIPPLTEDGGNEPLVVLRGHRSIVNQVRFNGHFGALASCSNDREIKFWTPLALPHSIHFKERSRYDSDSSFEPEESLSESSSSDSCSEWTEEGSFVSSISSSSNSSGEWDTDDQITEDDSCSMCSSSTTSSDST